MSNLNPYPHLSTEQHSQKMLIFTGQIQIVLLYISHNFHSYTLKFVCNLSVVVIIPLLHTTVLVQNVFQCSGEAEIRLLQLHKSLWHEKFSCKQKKLCWHLVFLISLLPPSKSICIFFFQKWFLNTTVCLSAVFFSAVFVGSLLYFFLCHFIH